MASADPEPTPSDDKNVATALPPEMPNMNAITAKEWFCLKNQEDAFLQKVILVELNYASEYYWLALIHTEDARTYMVGRGYMNMNDDLQMVINFDDDRKELRGKSMKQMCAAIGNYFTLLLDIEGTLWSAGSPHICLGRAGPGDRFQKVDLEGKCKQIAVGIQHSVALMENGDIYVWGCNDYGQHARERVMRGSAPLKIFNAEGLHVACGYFHSTMIDTKKQLWIWGDNDMGQLGLGHNNNTAGPKLLKSLTSVEQVACGWGHTLALTTHGELYSWGCNSSGELGLGDKINRNTSEKVLGLPGKVIAIKVAYDTSLALTYDGHNYKCYVWGRYKDEAVLTPRLVKNCPFPSDLLMYGWWPCTCGSVRLDVYITRLHRAVQAYDVSLVDKLIKSGHDVNVRNAEGETPLHVAASYKIENPEDIMKKLKGASINAKTFTGETPLMRAIRTGNVKSVEKLLNYTDIDVNIKDGNGLTALHIATDCDQLQFAKWLVKKKASPLENNGVTETPLEIAVEVNDLELMQCLLEAEEIRIKKSDRRKTAALHKAVRYNKENMVEILIRDGYVSVADVDDEDRNAIHVAAEVHSTEVLDKLIDKFSDEVLTAQTEVGMTPLDLAMDNMNVYAMEILLKHGATTHHMVQTDLNTQLHVGASAGRKEIVDFMLKDNPDRVNKENEEGLTALHLAAQFDKEDVANTLIEKRANIGAQDRRGNTPLHVAVQNGSPAVWKLLCGKNPDYDMRNDQGQTVLHVAAEHNMLDFLKHLTDILKAYPNVCRRLISSGDSKSNSPLHLAAQRGFYKVTEILLSNGANERKGNAKGETLLHVAARNDQNKFIRQLLKLDVKEEKTNSRIMNIVHSKDQHENISLHLAATSAGTSTLNTLLEAGSQPNAKNRHGRTPLFNAAESGRHEALDILIEKGGQMDTCDKEQMTPLHLAAQGGHEKIVKILIKEGAAVSKINLKGVCIFHMTQTNDD